MPPKVRVKKEDIIRAAVEVVEREGEQGLNARAIAAELSCSTQPIFTNYPTMERLMADVVRACYSIYDGYVKAELEKGEFVPYKANGMGYIEFAGARRNLFRLLFMRDRRTEKKGEDVFDDKMEEIYDLIRESTGMSRDSAELFHFEMWVVVHGLAVMNATYYQPVERSLASKVLTDVYTSLAKKAEEKDEK